MKMLYIILIIIDITYLIIFNIKNYRFFKNKNSQNIINAYIQGNDIKAPLSKRDCVFWSLYKKYEDKKILIESSDNKVYIQNIEDFNCIVADKSLCLKLCKNEYKSGDIQEYILSSNDFIKTSYSYDKENNIITVSEKEEPLINHEEKINLVNFLIFMFIISLIILLKIS